MHLGGCAHSPLLLLAGKPDHLHAQQHASQHAVTNKNLRPSTWRHYGKTRCVYVLGQGGGDTQGDNGVGCRRALLQKA